MSKRGRGRGNLSKVKRYSNNQRDAERDLELNLCKYLMSNAEQKSPDDSEPVSDNDYDNDFFDTIRESLEKGEHKIRAKINNLTDRLEAKDAEISENELQIIFLKAELEEKDSTINHLSSLIDEKESIISDLQNENNELANLKGDELDELDINKLDELQKIIQSTGYKIEKRKRDLLMEKEQQFIDQKLCCVCCEREKNVLILQCKHMCVCAMCASSLTKCPICRRKIESSIQIYV